MKFTILLKLVFAFLFFIPYSSKGQTTSFFSEKEQQEFNKLDKAAQTLVLKNKCRKLMLRGAYAKAKVAVEYSLEHSRATKNIQLEVQALNQLSIITLNQKQADEALNYALQALKKGQQLDTFGAIMSHATFTQIYLFFKAPHLALGHKIKEYELREKFNSKGNLKHISSPYLSITQLAKLYYTTGNFKQAKDFYLKTIALSSPHTLAKSYNNVGLCYRNLAQYDSAMYFFNKGLELTADAPVTDIQYFRHGLIQGSIAKIYSLQGNSSKAIELLEINYARTRNFKKQKDALSTGIELCRLYLKEKKQAKAKEILNDLEQIYPTISNLHQRIGFLQNKLNYSFLAKNDADILRFNDSILEIRRQINKENTQKLTDISEILAEYRKFTIEQKLAFKATELAYSKKENNIVLIGSCILFISLGLLIFFLYKNNRKKIALQIKETELQRKKTELQKAQNDLIQIELRNKELEQKQLKEELSHQQQDLTNLSLDITRRQHVLEDILHKIDSLVETQVIEKTKPIKLLLWDIETQISIDKKLEHFQKNIDTINDKFYHLLKEEFSTLTENDLQLCALFRLGMSNKEIATLKNIAPDSAKKSRNRLRKKLNLAPTVDLIQFLKSIAPI